MMCFLGYVGLAEKTQLLKLSVPATFMLVALDEGPGPPIKYQYAELGKLYTVVSQLLRCCDVSSRMQSSINGECWLINRHWLENQNVLCDSIYKYSVFY